MSGIGLYFFLWGLLISSIENSYDDNYYYDDDEALDESKAISMISGGVCFATGVGLMIGGAVKRSQIGKVFTKKGRRISLRPELDAINDRYGMRSSLSF